MPAIKEGRSAFLSGVILAAGASTRLGRPKQLLPLGDRCLLQHALDEALSSRLDEVILVLGYRAEEIREALQLPAGRPMRVVINPDYTSGLSASLRLGLRSADPRMAAAFLAADSLLVRPVYSGSAGRRVPGHPVFLARRIWPEVEKLRGDQGARALVSARPEWLLEVPVDYEPPADVDTWEDYQRAVDAARAMC